MPKTDCVVNQFTSINDNKISLHTIATNVSHSAYKVRISITTLTDSERW